MTSWGPLDVPLDPLAPPGYPHELLKPSISPVLPYTSPGDLSNVAIEPMGHPRSLFLPPGIP